MKINNYELSEKRYCDWCGEYHKRNSIIEKEHRKELDYKNKMGY